LIEGTTRVVGLLGLPVAGSLSPRMQNAAFAALALDWAYVPLPVEPDGLADAVSGLAATGFAGANVTTPHKLAAAVLVETREPSVNTLLFRDGRALGFSTDAAVLEGLPAERPVIIGDGGAARAFVQALPQAQVFSRRTRWPPVVSEADLVVHATSARDDALVHLRPGQTLIDLPYPETETAAQARRAGATVIDGLDVLVAQGAAAFRLWTDLPPPVDVMRAAVRP